MPARRPVDPGLLRRAQLPRGNRERLTLENARTREERRAVRRWQYLARRAARPTTTAREALGHAPPGSESPRASFFARREEHGDPTLLVLVEVRRADLRRLARYDALVRQLRAGRLAASAFERRVSRWRPVVVVGPSDLAGRWLPVASPNEALGLAAVADTEGVEEWIDSGRTRPLPRRRRAS